MKGVLKVRVNDIIKQVVVGVEIEEMGLYRKICATWGIFTAIVLFTDFLLWVTDYIDVV